MTRHDWIPFLTAVALLADNDAPAATDRLLRALRLGEVRSRGIPAVGAADPIEIDADLWATWKFLPTYKGPISDKMRGLQWLVPSGLELSRVCRGYGDVRLFRSDVVKLASRRPANAIKGDAMPATTNDTSTGPNSRATCDHGDLVAYFKKLVASGQAPKNREEAHETAELNFGGRIQTKVAYAAIKEAGAQGRRGRPRG